MDAGSPAPERRQPSRLREAAVGTAWALAWPAFLLLLLVTVVSRTAPEANATTGTLFTSFAVAAGFVGATQLVVLLPAALVLRRQRRATAFQALVVTGCVVALLNATCWAVFAATFR